MRSHEYIKKLIAGLVHFKIFDHEEARDLYKSFQDSEYEQFDDFLLQEGLVDRFDLLRALSAMYEVPYMDVTGYFFETQLLHQFPLGVLMRNAIIPYEQEGDILLIVAADPSNPDLLDLIGEHVSYDIVFNVGLYIDIVDAVRQYYDPSLTEPISDEKRIQNREINDLPVVGDIRDQELFLTDKIHQFEKHATQKEREDVVDHAHNAENKKK